MSVVLPAEGDVGVGDVDEAMIGDRDPMRVASQIVQDMFGTAEGPLGVDHPVFAKQGTEEGMERLLLRQRKTGAKERKLLPAKGALEAGYELASKDPAQNSDRQKEVRR